MLGCRLGEIKKDTKRLYEVHDRFSFDNIFRLVLNNDFEYEDALNFILSNCSLSTLVFQERVHNKYYLNIHPESKMSDDLIGLRNRSLFEIVADKCLDFKRNVGAVSEEIRKCSPRTIEEWRDYYFRNVRAREHVQELGRKLYIKISETISAEVEDIMEEDCIEYMFNMVIDRTFDGYMTEIKTIYGQLQKELDVKIEPAPDEWDRLYNVDFFIKVADKYIGLQIKPTGDVSHIPQIFKERSIQEATHEKFAEEYGGRVFYVISIKEGRRKKIYNTEVISEIQREIKELKK